MTAPLPPQLTEIAGVVGREAALDLALAHGGAPWRIPPAPDDALRNLVGADPAQRLCDWLGGERVTLPRARPAVAALLTERGWSTAQIARRLGIDPSAVRRYRRQARRDMSR